jgi:type VI secretion system secreted protein VgrG
MPLSSEPGHEARFLFEVLGTSYETRVVDFTLNERISSPFELNVSLASEDEIKFDDVVGKEALLTLLGEDTDRYCHGIISKFMFTGSRDRFYLYQARVVPSLWLLSLEQDCRIFQNEPNETVEDIVKKVLQDGGITSDRFDFRLQNKPSRREYCVQYRETDLNFISRLLEEEGIFYFFEHTQNKHLLVFGDSTVAYQPVQGNADVPFNPAGMVPGEEYVYGFNFSQRVYSGKITQRDFNFEKPSLDLKSEEKDKSYEKLEVYDYPGKYLDQNRGKKLTQIRLQESITYKEKVEGQSACPRFIPGFKFKLKDHERNNLNQEYLLVELIHNGTQPQSLEERSDTEEGTTYSNDFMGIPSSVTFRPEKKTPKTIVEGMQSAIVTGPKGEEIYTDEYGRVKVQFHWDREGKKDDKSSCWIRASTRLAGGNYGMIFIPRIGQEVLVDFLEGDPDQPIITGLLYNADNMPPYKLPDEKTKSTIKTNSSIGGNGFNEIRFEDEKGKEQIFIHGEKDLDIRIKSDRRESIGNDRHLIVKRDLKEKIEFDKHVMVGRNEFREVKTDYNLKVGGMSAVWIVGSSSRAITGDAMETFDANHSEAVNGTYHLMGMNLKIEGMTGIELKVGGSSIVLTPAAIFIQGAPLVNINSGSGPPVASVTPGSIAPGPPSPPDAAADAVPGKDVSSQEKRHKEPTDEEEQEKKSWIEIELVDEEDNPVPRQRYKVTLPDGKTVAEGTLNEKGYAKISGIDPGSCKITFPNLDKDAWEKA